MKSLKPTSSKFLLTAAAALVFTTTAALADREVRRIDHPNGRATFVAKPTTRTTTVGIFANEQGLAPTSSAQPGRSDKRVTRIQLGRGQYIPLNKASR
ncbi:MAG: hypothetical protein EOP84_18145 [Verrucomicrobiaceae bacterium]|nr:MAG: hypothetical protein EOP84_18145 [Verrucomicrobiaceae bacterium]